MAISGLNASSGSFATVGQLETAGGLVLVTDQSFSAVSSLSLNGCFTSDYTNYSLVINGVASANSELVYRYRASGVDESGLVYSRGNLFTGSGSTGFNLGSSSSTVAMLNSIYTTGRFASVVNIFEPNTASVETNQTFAGVANTYFAGYSRCTATTRFDGLTIFPNSGNITGTIRVYGYKD